MHNLNFIHTIGIIRNNTEWPMNHTTKNVCYIYRNLVARIGHCHVIQEKKKGLIKMFEFNEICIYDIQYRHMYNKYP